MWNILYRVGESNPTGYVLSAPLVVEPSKDSKEWYYNNAAYKLFHLFSCHRPTNLSSTPFNNCMQSC